MNQHKAFPWTGSLKENKPLVLELNNLLMLEVLLLRWNDAFILSIKNYNIGNDLKKKKHYI